MKFDGLGLTQLLVYLDHQNFQHQDLLGGKKGVVGTQFKSVKIWQKYTNKKVYGVEINSDHFIPEESPKQTTNHLKKFFLKNVKNNSK